jgi:hypothetical protein
MLGRLLIRAMSHRSISLDPKPNGQFELRYNRFRIPNSGSVKFRNALVQHFLLYLT